MPGERKKRIRRDLIVNCCLAIASTLLCLAALEIWARYNVYADGFIRSDNPQLRWEIKYRDKRARFDNDGKISVKRKSEIFRIAMLGDSVAFGAGLKLEQSPPFRLTEQLNGMPALSDRRFEVLNAAVPGYDIHQIATMYEYRVLPYDPDMVLYVFYPNDFLVSDYIEDKGSDKVLLIFPDAMGGIERAYRLPPWLLDNSSLANFLYTRYLVSKFSITPETIMHNHDYERAERSLRRMRDTAQSNGHSFYVVLATPFGYELPRLEDCRREDGADCWVVLESHRMKQMCESLGIGYFDIGGLLQRRGGDYHQAGRQWDQDHPNAEGVAIMAAEIARLLAPEIKRQPVVSPPD